MCTYKTLYLRLFGAVEDALELLERNRVEQAIDRLISAQSEAEEEIMAGNVAPEK